MNTKSYGIYSLDGYHQCYIRAYNHYHALTIKNKWCNYNGYDSGLYTVKILKPAKETTEWINSINT